MWTHLQKINKALEQARTSKLQRNRDWYSLKVIYEQKKQTWCSPDNKGHQLLYSAQACHDDNKNRWKINHIGFATSLLHRTSFDRSPFKILTVTSRVLKRIHPKRTVVAAITGLLIMGQMPSKVQASIPCMLMMMEALYGDPPKKRVFNWRQVTMRTG